MSEQSGSLDPILVSVKEAARALGLAPYTVYELRKAGSLTGVWYGNRWLITVESVRKYADALLEGQSA